MSLLSYNELCGLVELGAIGPVDPKNINGTSIDVHLGEEIIIETCVDHNRLQVIDLEKREPYPHQRFTMLEDGYYLAPGEFILAHTQEVFNLPNNISCEFKLKSSGARSGLENSLATWCDPSWHGSALTLELKNMLRYTHLLLKPGIPIGQMIFFRSTPVPELKGYATRGRYNNDKSVQEIKA